MRNKEVSNRVDNALKYLGPKDLINEFLNWMSVDEVREFLEHIEIDYEIDTTIDPD